jgi:hypothetical protein
MWGKSQGWFSIFDSGQLQSSVVVIFNFHLRGEPFEEWSREKGGKFCVLKRQLLLKAAGTVAVRSPMECV